MKINVMAADSVECKYIGKIKSKSYKAVVTISNDGKKAKARMTTRKQTSDANPIQDENIQNWNSPIFKKKNLGYEGKSVFQTTKSCPDSFIYVYTGYSYVALVSDSANASKIKTIIEGIYSSEDKIITSLDTEKSDEVENSPIFDDFDFCNDEGIVKVLKFTGYILFVIKILVPLALILFGSIDFIKAIVSSDVSAINKSAVSLTKRTVAGIIIFFIPTVISLVLSLIATFNTNTKAEYDTCYKCIVKPGDC